METATLEGFFSAIVRWCFSFIVLLFRISIFCCTVINFVLRLLPAISVFLSNGILDHCKVNANGINVEKLLFRLISSCKNVNKIRTRWTITKKKMKNKSFKEFGTNMSLSQKQNLLWAFPTQNLENSVEIYCFDIILHE